MFILTHQPLMKPVYELSDEMISEIPLERYFASVIAFSDQCPVLA
jgi:hypothetical protein